MMRRPIPTRWSPREHVELGWYACKWLVIAAPVGAIIGVAVAVFLWALNWATQTRISTENAAGIPWTLYLLPIAGLGVGLMYHLYGKSVEGGNNLIIDEIHEPGGGVPSRMTPLVLIGTVITHLFGGSAGREGTAVQMGGSIASTVCRWLRINPSDTRTLLMCGVAAGFGAVFGTPLTGAIFAVEVLAIGIVSFQSIVPCLIASIVGDQMAGLLITHWHVGHTHYKIASMITVGQTPGLSWLLLGKAAVAAVVFGLASVIFAELTHGLGALFKRTIRWPAMRPFVGGLIVIALALSIGPDYLGLGVVAPHHPERVTIVSSFAPGGAHAWSWWWKILFTAVTLSSGFKGGEVTPLFFVGAALGNTMGRLLHAPIDLFAGLGFVAVFAGATNTPLACTIMGIELFAAGEGELIHSGLVVYLAVACFLSFLLSGHSGIYRSQRVP
jgi:H+/Cl- antiporter ClcA